MKTTSLCLGALIAFSSPVLHGKPSEAAEPTASGDERPANHFQQMWQHADADGNGSLSEKEFFSLPRLQNLSPEKRTKLFQRLDKNSDGSIEQDEMHAGRRGDGGVQRRHARLWQLDKDGDGKIERIELEQGEFFQKLPKERQLRLFEQLDTNADGVISRDDHPHRMDRKRPRPLHHNEMEIPEDDKRGLGKGLDIGPQFPKPFDTSGDEFLEFNEFQKLPRIQTWNEDRQEELFEKLDINQDLRISAKEWISGMRSGPRVGF